MKVCTLVRMTLDFYHWQQVLAVTDVIFFPGLYFIPRVKNISYNYIDSLFNLIKSVTEISYLYDKAVDSMDDNTVLGHHRIPGSLFTVELFFFFCVCTIMRAFIYHYKLDNPLIRKYDARTNCLTNFYRTGYCNAHNSEFLFPYTCVWLIM